MLSHIHTLIGYYIPLYGCTVVYSSNPLLNIYIFTILLPFKYDSAFKMVQEAI